MNFFFIQWSTFIHSMWYSTHSTHDFFLFSVLWYWYLCLLLLCVTYYYFNACTCHFIYYTYSSQCIHFNDLEIYFYYIHTCYQIIIISYPKFLIDKLNNFFVKVYSHMWYQWGHITLCCFHFCSFFFHILDSSTFLCFKNKLFLLLLHQHEILIVTQCELSHFGMRLFTFSQYSLFSKR